MAKRSVSLDTSDIQKILDGTIEPIIEKRLRAALKTIKVSSAKSKGRSLQQDACEMISRITGIEYNSGEDGLIESRGMGQNGVDVALRGEARRLFPFSVESKCVENLNIVDAITQAQDNMYPGTDWLVYHKRKSLKEPVVILSASAFEKLCKKGK